MNKSITTILITISISLCGCDKATEKIETGLSGKEILEFIANHKSTSNEHVTISKANNKFAIGTRVSGDGLKVLEKYLTKELNNENQYEVTLIDTELLGVWGKISLNKETNIITESGFVGEKQ